MQIAITRAFGIVALSLAPFGLSTATAAQQPAAASSAESQKALITKYCVGCHNERRQSGKTRLDNADINTVGEHPELWERVVRKIRGGVMPPPGNPRPEKVAYDGIAQFLESELDKKAAKSPNPGRTEAFHRLNRTEYKNIVRDLLAMDMDFTDLLPIDDSGGGEAAFDNIASSLRLTQTLMEQYLSVGLKVARLAVGGPPPPAELSFKISAGLPQDVYFDGMPFGTRGGIKVDHIVPVDGEYEIRVNVEGRGRGQIDVAVDGERVKLFDFAPAAVAADYDPNVPPPAPDALVVKLPLKAGPAIITAAFLKTAPTPKVENDRTPLFTNRAPVPAVSEVIIKGPISVAGRGQTPSRKKIFTCRPSAAVNEDVCARQILGALAKRAYRRPLTARDNQVLLAQFKEGRADGGDFDSGIERGIRAMLANPNFLLRVSAEPTVAPANGIYRISDIELASRLSFFLWSSMPDDQLMNAAVTGTLHQPLVLEKQVRRMLADPKAATLTSSFASQWLWVRNLKAASPTETLFPNFDESLRVAFKTEMEMFFDSIVRENRSVVDLIDGDYTFLNERLAKHYGIQGVYGTDFRRVKLTADSPRRGILGKGQLLLVTSRSTRTSPVVRGKWILENLLGTPPPAPPANVPPLPEQKQSDGRVLTVRELMAKHRANPVCASCHGTIDPLGFSLEQFDAVGKWRTVDAGFQAIDASGMLPDGSKFAGINDFRAILMKNKEQFITTMTNKLMMYALGRGTGYWDAPAIRKIVRASAADNYKFSTIVMGIVTSAPFQMRQASLPARQASVMPVAAHAGE